MKRLFAAGFNAVKSNAEPRRRGGSSTISRLILHKMFQTREWFKWRMLNGPSPSYVIVTFLQGRDKDVDIALEIEKGLNALRETYAKEIWQKIAHDVRSNLQEDWQVNARFSSEIYSGLTVRRANWPSGKNARGEDCICWVGFEFVGWNWKNAIFGVNAHQDIIAVEVRSLIAN
jgi:hypothetical protein